MKMLILLCAGIGISMLMQSCCSDEKCFGASDIAEVELYGFSKEDIDTVILTSYNKNSGYITPIDSYRMVTVNLYNDRSSAYLENNVNLGLDYKLNFISLNRTYKISNFTTSTQKCNTGLFCNDKYDELSGYDLNGSKQAASVIMIKE